MTIYLNIVIAADGGSSDSIAASYGSAEEAIERWERDAAVFLKCHGGRAVFADPSCRYAYFKMENEEGGVVEVSFSEIQNMAEAV